MPTLSSIPIHGSLRDKLENLDKEVSTVRTKADETPKPSSTVTQPVKRKSAREANIHTPQALLSRDPNQIRHQIDPNIPLDAVLDLRSSVADALIKDKHGGHGIESKNLVKRVDGLILNSDVCSPTIVLLNKLRKLPPFIEGSFSALDYSTHTTFDEFLFSKDSNPNAIHTGSRILDDILSPPIESRNALRSTFTNLLSDYNDRINNNGLSSPNDSKTNIFEGGVAFGFITEATGPPASGKTQLALTLTANAAQQGINVHYLASGGGNSTIVPLARRLYSIIRNSLPESQKKNRKNDPLLTNILQRVSFYTVKDGYHALAIMGEIQQALSNKDIQEENTNVNAQYNLFVKNRVLLVLDSVSGCLSTNIVGDKRIDGGVGSALVHEVGMTLRRMARVGNHAIFVTNGVVGSSGIHTGNRQESGDTICNNRTDITKNILRNRQPAMKNLWKVADIRIFLDFLGVDHLEKERYDKPNSPIRAGRRIMKAVLEKHYAKLCDPKQNAIKGGAEFVISAVGITDL